MKREKVLIVEDEMDLLDLIDFNLTREGFVTESALDGLSAIEKIGSFVPDIVVLDLMLPKLDGWEVCRRIKRMALDIPVIMLTAKSMPEDKVLGFESGADDYITKPFSIKELVIRMEKLLEKSRGKELNDIFLHELTNRMQAIGGLSEILYKKDCALPSENRSAYLRNIRQQVACTTELISEVGLLTDIESGGIETMTEKHNLIRLLMDVSRSCAGPAVQKGVCITMHVHDDLPDIDINQTAVKQVIANIIGNAVKYGRENGHVDVSIMARVDGAVIVAVKDDGIGIPPEELPLVFEKGYRATNARERANGSGFGLYIVKKLLDRMGAEISVTSAEGGGSEFTVALRPPALPKGNSGT